MVNVNANDTVGFEQAVIKRVVEAVDGAVSRTVPRVKVALRDAITKAIEDSPEYESIATGRLWHELGVENPGPVLLKVIAAVQEAVSVKHVPLRLAGSHRLDGGMSIGILRVDLSEVLSLSEASFLSQHGFKVDWLEWLLMAGEHTVIADYCYVPISVDQSRTGLGIMTRSMKGWRVPAEFAGTSSDNWLTRALNAAIPDMEQAIVNELKREL